MPTHEEQCPHRLTQVHDGVKPAAQVSRPVTSCSSCAVAGPVVAQPPAHRQFISSFASGAAWTAGKMLMSLAIKAYNAL